MTPIAFLFGLTFVLLAVTPGRAADADMAAATAVIDRVDADWLGAMTAKDGDRIAAAYAEDGVFVLANGQTIGGRAAIAQFYRRRMLKIGQVLGGGIHRDGLAQGADGVVYEWGHGGATTVDVAGRRATTDGPYLTVWRRDAGGAWRIIRNLVF
jgi:uncharacterized protein (TIGR02246 family)